MNSKSAARKWYESLAARHLPVAPTAILVVSAHWEESALKVYSVSGKNTLFYDYYGMRCRAGGKGERT
jgi:aromatic ring-opening dioxygenase catalytic subunit (LigB family)